MDNITIDTLRKMKAVGFTYPDYEHLLNYGMLFYYNNDEYSFSKPYSDRTAELIDDEVKNMINEQYERAKKLLSQHKEGHNQLAQLLVEKEVIFAEDVERIFGKRPWASRSEEIMNNDEKKQIEPNDDQEELLLENKEA